MLYRKTVFMFAAVVLFMASFCIGLVRYFHLPPTTHEMYSANQAWSFLHGRTDLEGISTKTHDIAPYQGAVYAYWGPLPALLMMPIVSVTGPWEFPQRWFAIGLGAIGAGFFFLLFSRLSFSFGEILPTYRILALTAAFALGSSNLIFSMVGNVWFVSQLAAAVMTLGGLAFAVDRRPHRRTIGALLGGLGFGASIMGRPNLILSLPIWIFLAVSNKYYELPSDRAGWREVILRLAATLLPVFAAVLFLLWLNMERFGNPFDFGIAYMNQSRRFAGPFQRYGLASLQYVPWNAYVTLLRLPMAGSWDGVDIREGFSFFVQVPIVLLAFLPRFQKSSAPLKVAALISAAIIMGYLMMFLGTGWVQWGARYLHDALPFLGIVVFLARGWRSGPLLWIVMFAGIAINLAGVRWWCTGVAW